MRRPIGVILCLLVVTGCGADDATTRGPAASESAPVLMDEVPLDPPALVLRTADGAGEVTLPRGGGCWSGDQGGSCIDLAAEPRSADLPVLVGSGPVSFDFPIAGYAFSVAFTDFPDEPRAKRSHGVDVAQPVPGRFVITAPPGSGDLQVALSGTGPHGDLSASFRWQLPESAGG